MVVEYITPAETPAETSRNQKESRSAAYRMNQADQVYQGRELEREVEEASEAGTAT